MNGLQIQNSDDQGVRHGESKDAGGLPAESPSIVFADQPGTHWQHLQRVQAHKMRHPKISACRTPIHDRKSWTSILDTYGMRSLGDHHDPDGRGSKENGEP